MSNLFRDFKFQPHKDLPFRDVSVLDRCRLKKEEDYLALNLTRPNWKLSIVDDDFIWYAWLTDMVKRIKDSDEKNEKCVMILPNPAGIYKRVAYQCNQMNISCRNLIIFTMDEWADQDGNIAPQSYSAGFTNAFFRFFYNELNPELRPKMENIHFPTNQNIDHYSKMIEDEGEADIMYSACGWSGHAAFIDAVPEFGVNGDDVIPVEEWVKMGARISSLHLLTLAQNSLHASFGMSGDIGVVPPKAATIGPRDFVKAKHVFEFHNFLIGNTDISWEKMMSRLVCFGPVTPLVPDSVIQLCNAEVYISQLFAAPINIDSDRQYR
ncbi:MAG: hypothetical protein RRZ24_06155 [Clostridia bacterium]